MNYKTCPRCETLFPTFDDDDPSIGYWRSCKVCGMQKYIRDGVAPTFVLRFPDVVIRWYSAIDCTTIARRSDWVPSHTFYRLLPFDITLERLNNLLLLA